MPDTNLQLPDLPYRVKLTPIGLELPPDIDYAQWCEVGRALGRLITSTGSWALADWWISGQFSHGERQRLVKAPDWDARVSRAAAMPELWRAHFRCHVDMTL